jgi:hypothetical protein
MKYVLDASAALPWVLPEKDSAKAIQLRDDARKAVHELLAADIFPAEVFNSLLKAERTKRISGGEAKTLYASIGADIPALHPYLPFHLRAIPRSSARRDPSGNRPEKDGGHGHQWRPDLLQSRRSTYGGQSQP